MNKIWFSRKTNAVFWQAFLVLFREKEHIKQYWRINQRTEYFPSLRHQTKLQPIRYQIPHIASYFTTRPLHSFIIIIPHSNTHRQTFSVISSANPSVNKFPGCSGFYCSSGCIKKTILPEWFNLIIRIAQNIYHFFRLSCIFSRRLRSQKHSPQLRKSIRRNFIGTQCDRKSDIVRQFIILV